MSEHGIILRSEQVLAFLNGATQMRVPMKPQPRYAEVAPCKGWHESRGVWRNTNLDPGGRWKSPFGVPGDTVWFKESIRANLHLGKPVYRASIPDEIARGFVWRSPTSMPRGYARIVRTVKRVWVERVYDIIPGDCIASIGNIPGSSDYAGDPDEHPWDYYNRCFASPFVKYWDKTWGNPKLPLDQEDPMLYESGPCVWCCEFEEQP